MSEMVIKNLSYKYKTEEQYVLRDINLELEAEKIHVILGKNGSGKTTFFNCLFNYLDDYKGEIISNRDILHVMDKCTLPQDFKVGKYLNDLKKISKNKINNRLDELIEKFELTNKINHKISNLSLGQKHKLSLAIGIAIDYDIYLLDEPLTSLDMESQKQFINELKCLCKLGKTIVISTHIAQFAQQLADEILFLSKGKIKKMKNNFQTIEELENYTISELNIHK